MDHMFTSKSKVLVGYVLVLLFCSYACSDGDIDFGHNGESKSFGQAANVIYSCEVSTLGSDGTKWSYQTDEIMNLMRSIQLVVYQNEQRYGPLNLNKVNTDTFSDGNLTVRLVQVGAGKSIEVEHRNTSLFARAENGWCSAKQSDRYADAQPGDSWSTNDGSYDTFSVDIEERCSNPCSFSVVSNMNIKTVVYEVDGWMVAETQNAAHGFATSYTFNTPGKRLMTAKAYDHYGRTVATAQKEFELVDPQLNTDQNQNSQSNGRAGSPINVPYYYQYDNRLSGGSSCQNTSIAMILSYLGANIHPDEITGEFGKDLAQSVPGLNRVFNSLAQRRGVRGLNSTSEGTLAQLKAVLDRGEPAIVHGYFTSYGHVVVVTGYDEGGYYVNDPAGTWSQQFRGGYPYAQRESTEGRNIYYSRDAFERAVATYDGYTLTTIYLHTLK